MNSPTKRPDNADMPGNTQCKGTQQKQTRHSGIIKADASKSGAGNSNSDNRDPKTRIPLSNGTNNDSSSVLSQRHDLQNGKMGGPYKRRNRWSKGRPRPQNEQAQQNCTATTTSTVSDTSSGANSVVQSPDIAKGSTEDGNWSDNYAIGFSMREWESEVLGRMVLPTGLEKSLTAQILHTYEARLFPSAESIELKRAFIEKFATILILEFPEWEIDIHVFGSSVNGLGTSRSDVDICLTTQHRELEDVYVLNRALRKYGMRTYCVPHARVPIVKAWDYKLRIASDLNVNNTIALHNTRMIQTFVALDSRVRPFVMAIKYWTKCRELNDAAFGGTLSPYAWVNLAINFLQMREPPILPVIHPPAPSLNAEESKTSNEPLDLAFNDNINQLRGCGLANEESLGFLLYAFFRTYAYEFDYRHQVVSLRHGTLLTKEQKGWNTGRPSGIFCIEEPFMTWLNLGHSANTVSVEGIRMEFQRAFCILRDGGSYDDVCDVYQPQQAGIPTVSVSSPNLQNVHEPSGEYGQFLTPPPPPPPNLSAGNHRPGFIRGHQRHSSQPSSHANATIWNGHYYRPEQFYNQNGNIPEGMHRRGRSYRQQQAETMMNGSLKDQSV